MRCSRRVVAAWFLATSALAVSAAAGPDAGLQLTGADFAGGAREKFGSARFGEPQVNYVYARPTGAHSSMRAEFELAGAPEVPQFLFLKARDDDGPGACAIKVTLNSMTLLEGRNAFPMDAWEVRRLAIPPGVLRKGVNELTITNTEEKGTAGMPPWFMVACCGIGGDAFVLRRDVTRDFFVTLPGEKRPLPEPLPEGAEPGFKIRGIKGWNWTPEQYLAEIPVLKQYKMNFMMNCYTSMFSGHPKWENRWWEPIPEARKEAYARVARSCRDNGINYCFGMHPQLASPRPMDLTSDEDFEQLWRHFEWAQSVGVRWFSISLDDVHVMEGVPIVGGQHAKLANRMLERLRARDPEARFILCPSWYWGDGTEQKQQPYLEALARELHPDVYLFWTGDAVVGRITRKAAETFRGLAKHRIILWDNYPVNDAAPTMHLAPVTGRDPDLCTVLDGYMSNPLCPQNQANRLPLLTCADYAYNPFGYDPQRSIGQAILHLAETPEQRVALKGLVEAYAGMLLHGQGTSFNAVRFQFDRLASAPHSRYIAEGYVAQMEALSARLKQAFPDRFEDGRKTLDDDVAWMKKALADKYGIE